MPVLKAVEVYPACALGYYDLAVILAKKEDDRHEALRCFLKFLSLEHDDTRAVAWALYSITCLYATAGQNEEALNFLARALEKGLRHRDHIDKDTDLDGLRKDPRFTELMRRYFPVA